MAFIKVPGIYIKIGSQFFHALDPSPLILHWLVSWLYQAGPDWSPPTAVNELGNNSYNKLQYKLNVRNILP